MRWRHLKRHYGVFIAAAANLGDDADTTAAIVGQLAGAYYGVEGIPHAWRSRVHQGDHLLEVADRLFTLAQGNV